MYVKKFEGDSLQEALNQVKKELGPDAIILKTLTKKGLKGAFAKRKIEITAAISEKSYVSKANVDKVLPDDKKEEFYNSSANGIANQIDNYSRNSGYGQLALNKNVVSPQTLSGLDSFLSDEKEANHAEAPEVIQRSETINRKIEEPITEEYEEIADELPTPRKSEKSILGDTTTISTHEFYGELNRVQDKFSSVEVHLSGITEKLEKLGSTDSENPIYELRKLLKSYGLKEKVVRGIVKKAKFEFSDEELFDEDLMLDFTLRELEQLITIGQPKFSNIDCQDESVFTLLISQGSSGQTTTTLKLATLNPGSLVIQYGKISESLNKELLENLYDIKIMNCSSISEILTECKKANEEKRRVFIDFRNSTNEEEEYRKFVESLERSFKNVESILCLSAIHSEIYNEKQLKKFFRGTNGVILTQLDQCLDYAPLLNLNIECGAPLMFYTTGALIPEDIEAATPERILAGLINL